MADNTGTGGDWGTTVLTNGDVRLKLCRHGPMFFNIHDTYVGRSLDLYGEYSEGECDLFGQLVQPGQTILDVGANIGALTIFLAHNVGKDGRVFAIDPQRVALQMLDANVTVNNLRNVETIHAAVGDNTGETNISSPDYARENNLGGVVVGGAGETVRMIQIDDLDLSACHFIKIDVEGYEREVLLGAKKTIASFMPVLYLENDRREKSPALLQTILDMGYRAYWHLPPLYNPNNFFENPDNIFQHVVSANMLCLSKAANQSVQGLTEIMSPDQWCLDDVAGSA